MTEEWVPTRIMTDVGLIHFEEYLVKRKAQDTVEDVIFDGVDGATPSPGVIEAIKKAEIIIVCPSNPIVSIGPILAVPGIKEAIIKADASCVGISPIIGGKPVRGPADKLMEGKDIKVSAVGVAQVYAEFLDVLVIDKTDQHLAPRIEELGVQVVVEQTLMTSMQRKKKLAKTVLAAAKEQKQKS
jgi:LPPG:FO 2-phospho-L-lactate transferase